MTTNASVWWLLGSNNVSLSLLFRCGTTISYSGMKPTMAELVCLGYHRTKCGNQTLCYLTSEFISYIQRRPQKFIFYWFYLDHHFIILCFSADGNYEVRYKSNVLIYPDGEVLWVPPAIYQVGHQNISYTTTTFCC